MLHMSRVSLTPDMMHADSSTLTRWWGKRDEDVEALHSGERYIYILRQRAGDIGKATVHLARWLTVIDHDDQCGVSTDIEVITRQWYNLDALISIIHAICFSARRPKRPIVGLRDDVG